MQQINEKMEALQSKLMKITWKLTKKLDKK